MHLRSTLNRDQDARLPEYGFRPLGGYCLASARILRCNSDYFSNYTASAIHNPLRDREAGQLRDAAEPEFIHQAVAVELDGFWRDAERS